MTLCNSLSNNLTIDLTDNKIKDINFIGISNKINYCKKRTAPIKIILNKNPLNCYCNSYDIYQLTKRKKFLNLKNDIEFIIENLKCDAPNHLKYKYINQLQLNELKCDLDDFYNGVICKNNCNCYKRPGELIFEINCNNKSLEEIPNIYDENYFNMDEYKDFRIELNLSNNFINSITNDSFKMFRNAIKLDISYNIISQIDLSNLSPIIKVINAFFIYFF